MYIDQKMANHIFQGKQTLSCALGDVVDLTLVTSFECGKKNPASAGGTKKDTYHGTLVGAHGQYLGVLNVQAYVSRHTVVNAIVVHSRRQRDLPHLIGQHHGEAPKNIGNPRCL